MKVQEFVISSGKSESSQVTSVSSGGENHGAVAAMWHMLCIIASVSFWFLLIEYLNPTKSLSVTWIPFSLGIFTYSIILNIKRRMNGRIQNTKTVRIFNTIINYSMSSLAAYRVKEYHNSTSDFLPAIRESGLPISFAVLFSTTLGLIVQGDGIDILEVLGSAFKVYVVLLITIKRVEAYYVAGIFLLLCVGCVCSDYIVRLASLFQDYIVTHIGVLDLTCFTNGKLGTLHKPPIPSQVAKKPALLRPT